MHRTRDQTDSVRSTEPVPFVSADVDLRIELHAGPLPTSDAPDPAGCGAVLTFEGVVRPIEGGRPLSGLTYEAYPPMTEQELRRLAECVAADHGLTAVHVHHSVGDVPVGMVSFRLVIVSAHRAEALAAADRFIAEMKRDVPLWKVPIFAGRASGGA